MHRVNPTYCVQRKIHKYIEREVITITGIDALMPRARDWNMRRVKVVLTLFCCATAVTPSLGEYIFGDAVVCPDTLPRAACEPGAAGLNPHRCD